MTPIGRSGHWQLRTRRLVCGRLPWLMGILNVTPDSFSDGGQFLDPSRAVHHALALVAQGADMLDIGGESTRPGALPVDSDEELRRVVPVVRAVCQATSVPVSIDTSKACVAAAALEAGCEIVNDVTGLERDPAMVDTVRRAGAAVCVMHMRGTPETMQEKPEYVDVVSEVCGYLARRRADLVAEGIGADRICLDPGIGFGKTCAHNVALLSNLSRLLSLGGPILIGHSRKRFLAGLLGDDQVDRTAATIGVALALAVQGVHVLRVHDVQTVRHALLGFEATGGLDERH